MMRHARHAAIRGGFTALLLTAAFAANHPGAAAADSVYFPETRHTVSGVFLAYWQTHGGLLQQGYPITEEFQETSATDNKPYTVQYFQRAVFELHPENVAPFNVLLSPLGTAAFHARYPDGKVPAAWTNADKPRAFPQTGHAIGGGFRAYWDGHGGLAQYGYPLTDEFQAVSPIDGKPYTMQYFERAVFESHPQAPPGFTIQLSLLGSMHYHERYETLEHPGPSQWAPAPGLAPATGKVLLNATFATADLSAWRPLPTPDDPPMWQMVNAHLQQAGDYRGESTDADTVFLTGDTAWRDIVFEAQVFCTSTDPVGVVWRAQGTTYYRATFYPALPNAHWKAGIDRVDAGHVTSLATVPANQFAGYAVQAWHTIRVVARGAHHQVSFDGVPVLDVQDAGPAQGQVGLYSFVDGATAFDNVRVQQPAP